MTDNHNDKNLKRYHYRGHEIKVWIQSKTADLLFNWGVVGISKTIVAAISLDAALVAAKTLIDEYLDKQELINDSIDEVLNGAEFLF